MTRRLPLLALCAMVCWSSSLRADDVERFDSDLAQKIGKALIDATSKLTDLPIKVALDETKATGLKAKSAATMVIPDSKLTAEVLKKIDREVVPIGVLYFHKITPVVADEAVAVEQHRAMEVTVETRTVNVNVIPLAAGRVAGRLVLLAYTKGKAPALVTELVEIDEKIDLPVDLSARKVGENRAAILVNVLGKYRAALPVAGQE